MAIYDHGRRGADDAKIDRDFRNVADDRSTRSPFIGFVVVAFLIVMGWLVYERFQKYDATTLRDASSPIAVPSTKPLTQQPTVPAPPAKTTTPAPTAP